MRTHLISILFGFIGCAAFFVVQAAVCDSAQVDKDDVVAECLPSDQGEKALLWLESEHGGLQLHCEKHVVLTYGMAQVPVSAE